MRGRRAPTSRRRVGSLPQKGIAGRRCRWQKKAANRLLRGSSEAIRGGRRRAAERASFRAVPPRRRGSETMRSLRGGSAAARLAGRSEAGPGIAMRQGGPKAVAKRLMRCRREAAEERTFPPHSSSASRGTADATFPSRGRQRIADRAARVYPSSVAARQLPPGGKHISHRRKRGAGRGMRSFDSASLRSG